MLKQLNERLLEKVIGGAKLHISIKKSPSADVYRLICEEENSDGDFVLKEYYECSDVDDIDCYLKYVRSITDISEESVFDEIVFPPYISFDSDSNKYTVNLSLLENY